MPDELKGKNVEEIRQYFKDLKEGSKEICRVKFLLVGNEQQGKTSLLHCLMKKPFKENIDRTDGIDIHIWEPKDSNVTFSAWDFAGQQVFIYYFVVC